MAYFNAGSIRFQHLTTIRRALGLFCARTALKTLHQPHPWRGLSLGTFLHGKVSMNGLYEATLGPAHVPCLVVDLFIIHSPLAACLRTGSQAISHLLFSPSEEGAQGLLRQAGNHSWLMPLSELCQVPGGKGARSQTSKPHSEQGMLLVPRFPRLMTTTFEVCVGMFGRDDVDLLPEMGSMTHHLPCCGLSCYILSSTKLGRDPWIFHPPFSSVTCIAKQ